MPKEKNTGEQIETESKDKDDESGRYYYDDAHGYQDYDPEKTESEEDDV